MVKREELPGDRWRHAARMRSLMLAVLMFVVSVLIGVGCDYRPPLERAQVAAIASNVCMGNNVAWGDPIEVLYPGQADADGRLWWQVRYRGVTEAGRARVVIVDNDTRWGRLPSNDYVIREPAIAALPVATTGAPSALPDGSFILVVVAAETSTPARDGELTREAMRLNRMANETNLLPAFAMWTDHGGRTALVWGWQGDRGTTKNDAVSSWLKARTAHRDPGWVDLLAR